MFIQRYLLVEQKLNFDQRVLQRRISLTKFISEQAVTMGPDLMAERVHEALVDKCPTADCIGLDEVREHIMVHTLCPNVR